MSQLRDISHLGMPYASLNQFVKEALGVLFFSVPKKDTKKWNSWHFFQPQNVLLTERLPHGDIKLCDLGFARKVRSGEDVRDIIGTPDYVGQYAPINHYPINMIYYFPTPGSNQLTNEWFPPPDKTLINLPQVM